MRIAPPTSSIRTHLLLSYDFPPMGGGIARMMGELVKRYPHGNLMVSTGNYHGQPDLDREVEARVDRLRLPSRRLRTVQGLLAWTQRAHALSRSVDPTFVWCGNFKPAAYPARWIRANAGIPYGIMLYGTELLLLQSRMRDSGVKRRVARTLLGSAAVLLVISRSTRLLALEVLAELGLADGPIDIRTVLLGTDPEHFRPGLPVSEVRRRYGLGEGRWLITVARIAAHKGIDTGLKVLSMLRSDFPELRYAVVGSGANLQEYQSLARTLDLTDRVRFLTTVPDADLPALYNSAEVYLGVSRQVELMMEGFGISLSEAAACAIPVIAGSSGGIPDAVRDGETGLLVDAASVSAVAGAVRRLLEDRDLARRLGTAGRRAVETFYNWNRVTRDVFQIAEEHALR